MLVCLSILNIGSKTITGAIHNVCKGLHLIGEILLRNRQMVENMGIGIDVSGADFNFVNSGRCGIQAVDNGTLTAVNLHTLIVTAAISKSGNLEADEISSSISAM